jgi:hypothetical protein
MHQNQQPPGGGFHQRQSSVSGNDRFLTRRFRSALHEVAGVVPVAHKRFHEIGRDREAPWTGYIIEMCREQLYRAAAEGLEQKAETICRIQRMTRELEAAILAGFIEEPGKESVPATALEFMKESTEAVVAFQTFRETGSEADAETARREVQDVLAIAPEVLDMTAQRRREMVRAVR